MRQALNMQHTVPNVYILLWFRWDKCPQWRCFGHKGAVEDRFGKLTGRFKSVTAPVVNIVEATYTKTATLFTMAA